MKQETLEERTESRVENIGTLMNNANYFCENGFYNDATSRQNQALYEQNKIIANYHEEICKMQEGKEKK